MEGQPRRLQRAVTLAVAIAALFYLVWRAQSAAPSVSEPGRPADWSLEAGTLPASSDGVVPAVDLYPLDGPGTKADPHMARAAARLEAEALGIVDPPEAREGEPAAAAPSLGDLLGELSGSKFGFGGLGLTTTPKAADAGGSEVAKPPAEHEPSPSAGEVAR